MKLGQIVRYRSWREGDTPKQDVHPDAHGWDRTGIVIRVCDWIDKGIIERGAGIEYLDDRGDIILAHIDHLEVINQPTRGSD